MSVILYTTAAFRLVLGPYHIASRAGLVHSYASNFVEERIAANVISAALVETNMVRSDRPEEAADVDAMFAPNGYLTG